MSYDNTNSGGLFRNKDKVPGDNKPNYTGTINFDGKEMRIAGWMNKSQSGVTYMSLKVTEPREQQQGHQNQDGMGGQSQPNNSVGDLDSDIPF